MVWSDSIVTPCISCMTMTILLATFEKDQEQRHHVIMSPPDTAFWRQPCCWGMAMICFWLQMVLFWSMMTFLADILRSWMSFHTWDKSNKWTQPTTRGQSWHLATQHDRQRKVRGILAIRRDIQVLGKWRDCWVQSSPFTFSKEKNNSVGIHGPKSSWDVSEVAQQLSKWQKTSRSLWWYAVWIAKLTNKWGR